MEIKMEKVRIESQGRILLPKAIRDRLGVRSGAQLALQVEKNRLVLRLFKSVNDLSSELEGCVRESKIRPLELKKIWRM